MLFLLVEENADYEGQDTTNLIRAWPHNIDFILEELEITKYSSLSILILRNECGKRDDIAELCVGTHMDQNFLNYPYPSQLLTDVEKDEIYTSLKRWCDNAKQVLKERDKALELEKEKNERETYKRLKAKFEK